MRNVLVAAYKDRFVLRLPSWLVYRVVWVSSAHPAPEDSFRGFVHWDYSVADHHPVFVVVQGVQGRQGFSVSGSVYGLSPFSRPGV